MKKINPIRSTVSIFVSASGKRKNKRRASMKEFFEDLGNRGSIHPHSTFQVFTTNVRKKMEGAGTWIRGDEDDLDFVAEYVCRLMREYLQTIRAINDICYFCNGRFAGYKKTFLEFREIYLKIRIWGLRTKRFLLRKWPLVQFPLNFSMVPQVYTYNYQSVVNQPVYRYYFLFWSKNECEGSFFVK